MLLVWKRALSSIVGSLVLQGLASAQCPLPDLLDGGPCCTLATPDLPELPNFSQNALDICWRDCNVEAVIPCTASWRLVPIIPIGAGPCWSPHLKLELRDGAGVLKWRGTLRRQYSRTWLETDDAGNLLQVWRFLLNGDLSPTAAAGPIPCPVPPCAPAHGNRVRFTGYLDYAQDCGTDVFEEAWMLTHSCDFIDHHPGFPRAGAFHPERAYTFVGPAAGFVPGPVQPIEVAAGSPFEDVRRLNLPPLTATCEYEERITFSINPFQQFCLCGQSATPQYSLASLSLNGTCGTSVISPGVPFLPGFLSMGIGMWTIPAVYPGVERLRWNTGGYDYVDPCAAIGDHEVFFGVTTLGGYPAIQLLTPGPGVALPLCFVDQANSLRADGTTLMNEPYVSDHILNLNHP
jgi:hypothetical protein